MSIGPNYVADSDAYAAMVSDPIVVRHAGKPMTGEEAWMRLLRHIGYWSAFGLFAMLDQANGRYLGDTGTRRFTA